MVIVEPKKGEQLDTGSDSMTGAGGSAGARLLLNSEIVEVTLQDRAKRHRTSMSVSFCPQEPCR
jgi:hypothetical protein